MPWAALRGALPWQPCQAIMEHRLRTPTAIPTAENHVATFTPSGQSAVYFTHDSRGRMTYDGASGVTIDYNYLNLTRKISGTGETPPP